MEKTLKSNPERVDENLKGLREELELLGGRPVLVALGYAAEKNLKCMKSEGYEVVRILHPATFIGKKKYRDKVLKVLDNIQKKRDIQLRTTSNHLIRMGMREKRGFPEREPDGNPGNEKWASREPKARPGGPTFEAAACYSPTPSRVQYHRRAWP